MERAWSNGEVQSGKQHGLMEFTLSLIAETREYLDRYAPTKGWEQDVRDKFYGKVGQWAVLYRGGESGGNSSEWGSLVDEVNQEAMFFNIGKILSNIPWATKLDDVATSEWIPRTGDCYIVLVIDNAGKLVVPVVRSLKHDMDRLTTYFTLDENKFNALERERCTELFNEADIGYEDDPNGDIAGAIMGELEERGKWHLGDNGPEFDEGDIISAARNLGYDYDENNSTISVSPVQRLFERLVAEYAPGETVLQPHLDPVELFEEYGDHGKVSLVSAAHAYATDLIDMSDDERRAVGLPDDAWVERGVYQPGPYHALGNYHHLGADIVDEMRRQVTNSNKVNQRPVQEWWAWVERKVAVRRTDVSMVGGVAQVGPERTVSISPRWGHVKDEEQVSKSIDAYMRQDMHEADRLQHTTISYGQSADSASLGATLSGGTRELWEIRQWPSGRADDGSTPNILGYAFIEATDYGLLAAPAAP